MAQRTISLTRALAEIKSTGDRIGAMTGTAQFMSHQKDQNVLFATAVANASTPKYFNTQGEFTSDANSKYDQVTALIRKINELKSKVIRANAETTVQIGNQEMTIAEAIYKKDAIAYDRALLMKLKRDRNKAYADKEALEDKLENRIKNDQDKTKDTFGKASKEELEQYLQKDKERAEQALKPVLLQVDKLDEEVERLEAHVEEFETNVDFALSEVNAKTEITVND